MATIIFATDFSEPSRPALPIATALARESHAKLLIVHVSELERQPVGELFDEIPSLDENPAPNPALAAKLEQITPGDASVAYEHRMLYGKPAEAIVQCARDEHAEKIVMGTHGYRGLTQLLAGSVAEAVIRQVPCPVIAVRAPKSSFGEPLPVAAPASHRQE